MSVHATLAILTHASDDFSRALPLIRLMMPRWESLGFKVKVVTDAEPFVPADIALLHVDLSVVPDSCRRLAERYPLVLNGGTLDIRKRRFSRLLLDTRQSYAGEVIVKTDWNFGGWREFRRGILESPAGPVLRTLKLDASICRKLGWIEVRRSWGRRRMLPPGDYPVFPGSDKVPDGVWRNANLIVERLVPERLGSGYCCRQWLFFGPREVSRRIFSSHPVLRLNATLEQTSEPVPVELHALRAELGFDYGKFDYGIVDGKVVLYDVNRTPGVSFDHPFRGRYESVADILYGGLGDIFEGRSSSPARYPPA